MQHYIYSSFGKILKIVDGSGADVTASPPVKTSYGFTNREHDSESGMMYYRARYMMPEIGRFISEDPDKGVNTKPQSFNSKYIYALNNPTLHRDPSGRIIPFLIAGLVAGTVKGLVSEGDFLTNFGQGFAIGVGGAVATVAFASIAASGAAAFGYTSATSAVVAGAIGGGVGNALFAHVALGATGVGLAYAAVLGAIGGGVYGANRAGLFEGSKLARDGAEAGSNAPRDAINGIDLDGLNQDAIDAGFHMGTPQQQIKPPVFNRGLM